MGDPAKSMTPPVRTGPIGAIPPVALDLARAFQAAGWPLFLVGGWVRDALLGTISPDLDFATHASPAASLEVLQRWAGTKVWTTGFEVGTVGAERRGARGEGTSFRTA